MKRILFYLPVVTPWWFDNIVVHMMRKLAAEPGVEVHLIIPPLWRNTGMGMAQLAATAVIPGLHCHLVDSADHISLRSAPEDPEGLVAFVESIDPDYVFCRSADIATPARFPGKVIHLMEAGAPPLSTRAGWLIFQPDFWHHGDMPALGAEDLATIDRLFAPIWRGMRYRAEHKAPLRPKGPRALEALGIPAGRKLLALPLEYEHEEAFTAFHNRFERNIDLVRHVAERLDEDCLLAVTDHPLNYRYVDNSALYEAIAALGDRVHLVPNREGYYFRTDLLIKNCDGLIVQNTKAIYSGAFFGKPMLRLSNRPSADWLGVSDDMASFQARVAAGGSGPSAEAARRWFGFHVLHEIIDAAEISAAEILDRLERPFSPDRLAAGLERLVSHQRLAA